jgi:hypothetical protein
MIGKHYFARQATTPMMLARLAKGPQVVAGLTGRPPVSKTDPTKAPLDPDAALIPADVQNKFG